MLAFPRMRGFEGRFNYFITRPALPPPPPFFFSSGDGSRTSITHKLRRLWPNISWRVACELVSLDSIVSLLRIRWVKGACVFRYDLPNDRDLLCATAVTWGWNGRTLEKNILPPLLLGPELATFRSEQSSALPAELS